MGNHRSPDLRIGIKLDSSINGLSSGRLAFPISLGCGFVAGSS
jgi:hypothetical protein